MAVASMVGIALASFLTAGLAGALSLLADPEGLGPTDRRILGGFFAWCLMLVLPSLVQPRARPHADTRIGREAAIGPAANSGRRQGSSGWGADVGEPESRVQIGR